jgi:hypothetical protein
VVFVHVLVRPTEALQKIVEIPYEIGRRLLYKTAMGFLQIVENYGGLGYTFVGTVIYENDKYYLSTRNSINQKYYATAILILKDI